MVMPLVWKYTAIAICPPISRASPYPVGAT